MIFTLLLTFKLAQIGTVSWGLIGAVFIADIILRFIAAGHKEYKIRKSLEMYQKLQEERQKKVD